MKPDENGRRLAGLRHHTVHAAIPALRALMRYGPGRRWREQLWWRVIEPYVCWHRHRFSARTRFGSRVAGDTSEVLNQHLYYFGEWEPDLTDWIAKRLRPGDVMVDVGANAGYYALLGSQLVGQTGAVVAIEASPSIAELLRANLARNRADNVRLVNVAASDSHGTLSLYAGYEAHLGLASVVEDQGAGVEASVTAAPLDHVLTQSEMRRLRLMKIDVEGAEWSVLSGFGALWDLAREDLEVVVEVHPAQLATAGRRVDDVVDLFSARGFLAHELDVDYSVSPYLSPVRARPRPAARGIDYETHLVFSRRDR